MTNEIISIAIKAIFAILGCILTYYFVPIAKRWMENYWVKKAVEAAEKIYQESGMGPIKYEYVVNFLKKIGILKLDENGDVPIYWKTLIESACKELDNMWGQIKDDKTDTSQIEEVITEENSVG